MNTDLFQWLTVALLGAITILLIVAIAALSRVRRALENNGSLLRDALARTADAPAATRPQETAEAPVTAAPQEEPAPTEAVEPAPATGAEEQAASVAAQQPVERQEAAAAGGEPAAEAEPQEQPFERDGRWWFRRGDELLVYDEQTGQWLEAQSTRGATSQYVAQDAERGAVATERRTATQAGQPGAGEAGPESSEGSEGFWKCPSCGAVNGAALATCRMCFTARP